jgi:hypothetical protein
MDGRRRKLSPSLNTRPPLRAAVLTLLGFLAADSAGNLAVAEQQTGELAILAPTLGQPAFVPPGGTLSVVAVIPPETTPPTLELVSERAPAVRATLTRSPQPNQEASSATSLTAQVPTDLPERTYDLVLRVGDQRLVSRHCVAVRRPSPRVRLVHLSNMNIGDLGAPDFDYRLTAEVNLLAPTLIVATGDFLDLTHDDAAAGWRRLVDFLCTFDAPLLIACGDHDDLTQYARHIAPSPVGVVDVGPVRGVVLLDLPTRPISGDPDQIRWLERALAIPGDDRPTFIVSHDEYPNLLRQWQRQGTLNAQLNAGRIAAWFVGGHQDWAGTEYRELIDSASPMLYVRTHQSSAATREGATGVPHYRVIDFEGDRAHIPGAAALPPVLPPALPVGRLSLKRHEPEDGTRHQVAFTAVNNHAFRLDDLRTHVLVAARNADPPWCRGVQLEAADLIDGVWSCRVRFGLPDKGALHAVVGCGSPPTEPELDISFDVTPRLELARRQTPEGLTYLTPTDAIALVHLANRGTQIARVTPLIRLDGQTLAYVVLDEPGPPATAYQLRIAPGGLLTLQVDLSAIRVTAGRRELQVYLKGLTACAPATCPLEIRIAP